MANKKVNGYVTKEDLTVSLAAVETRLNQKIEGVDQKVGTLDQKVNSLDQNVSTLDQTVKNVAVEVVRIKSEMKEMEHRINQNMRDNTSRVLQVVEDFMVKAEKVDRRGVLHGHRLEEHEKRLKGLEEAVGKK